MKIEYRKDTSNGPLIRLFDFSNGEILEVKQLLDQMTEGRVEVLPLHEHAHVNPLDNCHLTLRVGNSDQGILYKPDQSQFECVLTRSKFENMSQLLESFALHPVEKEGYEWLDETSDIALLISPSSRW
jgi:hypothetical protein